jgi:uncharacterized membrane protein
METAMTVPRTHHDRCLATTEPVQAVGRSLGERLADKVTAVVGSWPFIVIQSILLVFWIAANVWAWFIEWDPYPFILLNLVLSFQAAYTAPIIMMSQNRQADLDRERARLDYEVNIRAEREIEFLHLKIDSLRQTEILRLVELLEGLVGMPTLPKMDPARSVDRAITERASAAQ